MKPDPARAHATERDRATRLTPGGRPPAGATRDEIKATLGDPATVHGWWPVEIWEYGSGLLLTFRHGILESPAGG